MFHIEVSGNGGTPKSYILIVFSIINHPAFGVPSCMETPWNSHMLDYCKCMLWPWYIWWWLSGWTWWNTEGDQARTKGMLHLKMWKTTWRDKGGVKYVGFPHKSGWIWSWSHGDVIGMGIGGNHPHRLDFSYFVASEISFSQINVGVLNIHPLPFETFPFETGFFLGDLDMWEHLGDILVP